MDQPLHRFADPDHGLVDGALFSFAAGTNPEVLLLLECRQERSGELAWHYGCARMSSANCEAKIGDTIVWSCSSEGRWDATAPYYLGPLGDLDTVADDEVTGQKTE